MPPTWAEHMVRVRAYDGTHCTQCGKSMKGNQAKAPQSTPDAPLHWNCLPEVPMPWRNRSDLNRRRENIDYGAERLAEHYEATQRGWEV